MSPLCLTTALDGPITAEPAVSGKSGLVLLGSAFARIASERPLAARFCLHAPRLGWRIRLRLLRWARARELTATSPKMRAALRAKHIISPRVGRVLKHILLPTKTWWKADHMKRVVTLAVTVLLGGAIAGCSSWRGGNDRT